MKKIAVSTALALVLGLALVGCGSQASSSSASASAESESASSASVATASASASSASASSTSASSVTWTKVSSAADAAKGAGIDEFTVPKAGTKISIGELNPWEYCYAKDMAEADGSAAAAEIVIRKSVGNGDNTGEPSEATSGWSELSTMTYAHEWDVDADGTTVRCYGNAEGKALKSIWEDGKYSYSILALGQGDTWKEFGLPDSDIVTLVKGTKKAEAEQKQATGDSSASASAASSEEPGFDVEQAVWDNGLGEFVRYYSVEGEDGETYWAIVTRGSDGEEYTTYMDNNGNVTDDMERGDVPDFDGNPGFDVDQAVWDNGLGELQSYYPVEGEDGETYWGVVTRGSDGEEYTTYMDDNGNVTGEMEIGDVVDDGGDVVDDGGDVADDGEEVVDDGEEVVDDGGDDADQNAEE